MRPLLIFAFLLSFSTAFSQKQNFNMAEASVYCEAYPSKENYVGKVLQGTGFIIQHQKKFYFITCYHNIINHNFYLDADKTIEKPYQKLRLILKRKLDDKWSEMYINLVNDTINNFYKTTYQGREVDIIAVPLVDTTGYVMQVVTLPKTNPLKINDVVFVSGFPDVNGEKHFQLMQVGKVIPNPNLNETYKRFKDYPLEFINSRTSAGFSGSPVYVWPNTNKPPIIVGINAAEDVQNETGIFWRIEVLQNLLKSIPAS